MSSSNIRVAARKMTDYFLKIFLRVLDVSVVCGTKYVHLIEYPVCFCSFEICCTQIYDCGLFFNIQCVVNKLSGIKVFYNKSLRLRNDNNNLILRTKSKLSPTHVST